MPPAPVKPLILFIDAYDSFSHNIISLLETELDVCVRTVKIDCPALTGSKSELLKELSHYAAVVCGPGPGHPGREEDVGIMTSIWRLAEEELLPVLGICLGFQSLCLEFGAEVKRLTGPQHGMIRRVTHVGESAVDGIGSIFEGVGEVRTTLYQSLCVDIGQDRLDESTYEATKWKPAAGIPKLVPLAWVESKGVVAMSGIRDNRILVAARHVTKPFWALQYHPESICTNKESKKVIINWFKWVQVWNCKTSRVPVPIFDPINGQCAVQESLLYRAKEKKTLKPPRSEFARKTQQFIDDLTMNRVYRSKAVKLPDYVTVPDIVEAVEDLDGSRIVLESSNAHEISIGSKDVRGRYSIIALDISDGIIFEYRSHSHGINARYKGEVERFDFVGNLSNAASGSDVWEYLARFLDHRKICDGLQDSPFWGGFMGYTTYELGLQGIGVESKPRNHRSKRPDLCFAWVTRSLVVDHVTKLIYIQELADPKATSAWRDSIAAKIKSLSTPDTTSLSAFLSASHPLMNDSPASSTTSLSTPAATPPSSRNSLDIPDLTKPHSTLVKSMNLPLDALYEDKVRACQSHIRAGSSYELCLTSQTKFHTKPTDPWSLYLSLRSRQPAPFASFLRLPPATLVSASPERFLTYSRSGLCSLRPMKGTVRKTSSISTLEAATALLDVPKEKAENLMIVDLVRHDLHGVCGAGNVEVPRLMVVEEYRSVFQMISVVEGQLPTEGGYTGLDVLAASLPPGSMTGAPKKRSCELLQDIEGEERGLYSGVVGYMDVGGRGDWSVSIRCMFKWVDEGEGEEVWRIGAGGAVTILSTPVGEREEMRTKLEGTLGVFK